MIRWTERLDLRPVSAEDVDLLRIIHADPRTNQFRPGGAPSPASCNRMLEQFVADWREHGIGYWTVRSGGRVIGCAGVRSIDFSGRPSWNLYYRFDPSTWGRGLATEAATEAVRYAAGDLPPRPVVARTRPANAGGIAVAERAGLCGARTSMRTASPSSLSAGELGWRRERTYEGLAGYVDHWPRCVRTT